MPGSAATSQNGNSFFKSTSHLDAFVASQQSCCFLSSTIVQLPSNGAGAHISTTAAGVPGSAATRPKLTRLLKSVIHLDTFVASRL
jgi:hypothetical protein